MNILIVENELELAQVIAKNIEQWGHEAETAGTGKEALGKVRQKEFALALIDIFLPDVKGHELIPQFKEVWPDMWFVTMTGYNTRELELEVRNMRVAYYMTKPFEAFALKAVIDHMGKKGIGQIKELRD